MTSGRRPLPPPAARLPPADSRPGEGPPRRPPGL